ncbi:MAG TPA: HD domain-containing phosphohydrolase [Syntrophomonadaceae bacterium]|nr:HD domain-containing phosphohydrolase [Syntrophomonadaceae bacterium]
MKKGGSEIGVAIVGGGHGCLELMSLIQSFALEEFQARIIGVADQRCPAPGLKYAREQGYMTTQDYTDFYCHPEVEILIELTGVPQVLDHIYKTKPPHMKVIDHISARLFWDLMRHKADYRSRAILESIRDAFIVVDEQGKILQFNQRAQNMFPGLFTGGSSIRVSAFMKAVFGTDLYRFLDTEENVIYRLVAYPGSGQEFPIEMVAFQVEIEKNACWVFSFRDASERQRAQQEISRLQRWETVFNNTACAFGESSDLDQAIAYTVQTVGELFDAQGVVVCTIASHSRNLLLKSVYHNISSKYPDYRKIKTSSMLPFISENLESGNMIKIHNVDTLPHPDRSTLRSLEIKSFLGLPIVVQDQLWGAIFVDSRLKRFWSGDEVDFLLSIVNIIQNALTRKDVEESLHESETLYQQIVDHSLTGFYIIQKHRLVFVNQCLANLFGYDSEELLNRDPLDFIHPDDRHTICSPTSGERPGNRIVRGIKKDGNIFWVECSNSLITLKGKPAFIGNLLDVSERIINEQNISRVFESITMLAGTMVEQRDPYTAGHQRRVADICVAIGKKMMLSKVQLEGLRVAALLHDLGKCAVPIEILTKPGRLRSSETQFIQLHSQLGAEILSDIPFPWDVSTIVMQHHERLDGSGYPGRLKGDEIRIEARILAVADVLEAMSSHRPYRPSLGLESALQELQEKAGLLYDEQVVAVLQQILDTLDISA